MSVYYKSEKYTLYQGKMQDELENLQDNSIDSIVTDPPYGLTSITKRFGGENAKQNQYGKDGSFQRLTKGFMGKEWDGSGVELDPTTWEKCLRVLKPGGYLLAFGGTRTFHRIACAIEDAGFEIRDTIMWLYGSGFPKSMDISKQIDKRNGRYQDSFLEFGNYLKEKISDSDILCAKKVGYTPALVRFWKLGERIPNKETWLKLKNIYNLDNNFDWLIEREEAEREIIGTKQSSCFNNQEKNRHTIGSSKSLELDLTIPSTDLAKQWQSWGTALKPSYEPIIVARKPFKGSLVDNVIEYGVGALNIDGCRIGTGTGEKQIVKYPDIRGDNYNQGHHEYNNTVEYEKVDNGRFPSNTILTYDNDNYNQVCSGMDTLDNTASRYFYCAKASKRDRDEGCELIEEKLYWRTTPDKDENNLTGLNKEGRFAPQMRKNTHPTVKPTTLMQYLIRLVTPSGGVVLDPFMGSGSTGKAAMYENLDRNANYRFIGVEMTEEYLPIAKARIEYAAGDNEPIEATQERFEQLRFDL